MTSSIADMALAISRRTELSILGKATVLLALGLTAAWLARSARASVRHLQLAVTFAALLGLPLVMATAPRANFEVPASGDRPVEASPAPPEWLAPSTARSRPAPPSTRQVALLWPRLLRSGWLAGVTILLLSLVVDLWRTRHLRRDGLPWFEQRALLESLAAECGVHRRVEILLDEDVVTPFTCGAWHPVIVLPSDAREWNEANLRRALVHELEHVRRGDWMVQVAARAVCACYWFHPLVWVAWRQLCLEAERACDDAVVQGTEQTDYAEQLVALAERMSKARAQPALGMAKRSDLSSRVSAVLDGSRRRGRAGLLAAVAAICIASLIVLAIAPIRAVAQSKGAAAARPASPVDRALFEAAESGDISGIENLLNAGAHVNSVLSGDGSPLIGAARNGQIAAVRLLLDRGADPDLSVRGDGSPLIMAAREGHADVVALLLDRGASIDQIVSGDENALIQACGQGHLEVAKLLVSRHADVNARAWIERSSGRSNGEWRTPLSMARRNGHAAVVDFLVSAGAAVGDVPDSPSTDDSRAVSVERARK